ncbi:Permease of the drug/metabolite transporter (DMT) superfamily [Poseidonocella pacifica]|uniref:Permease of the drug/metabolite transporter (DMT) superfamily n=1 Tax=Poseidonocella pacifica TaxID=871651 RepID=A0A1I0VKL5_9RHOB|nr:DMT family transporter [Poseidonocella pacifica]SFA76738.1 Permease of the drug/metabolite transporter (DMT) superfamily [Poseidonocella pacifica]
MENLRGILFMTFAMAGFAVEDMFIKAASQGVPVGEILLLLGFGGGPVFALLAWRQGQRLLSPVLLQRPVVLRNLAEIIGTCGFVSAIALIPLTTASAIAQAMPLVVTMGAALIFGEQVGWRRWSAIGVGFLGVMVIIRPGLEGFDPLSLLAVLAVFGLAGRDLAARAVPRSVPNLQLAAYGFLMLIPTGVILLGISGPAVWPSAFEWGCILGAIVFGAVSYYAITVATRLGDVSVITPFRYSRLIFALIIGTFVFGERPDSFTWIGMALIIGSGLYTILRERRLARRGVAIGHPNTPVAHTR